MKKITIDDVLTALDWNLLTGTGDAVISGVAVDTRKLNPGDLFVALPGERVHGNSFIPEALEKGCAAVLAAGPSPDVQALAREKGIPLFQVEDSLRSLQDLAAWYLSQFSLKKVGVTGSVGKTITKDMTWHVLSEKYRTVRSEGNSNSQSGLPLAVFQVEEDTEAAVFEMGMDVLGEVHRLADIVRPDMAIITNVGVTHIETLGSRENILKAKLEITDFFTRENTLIINGDNDMLAGAEFPGEYRLFSAGETTGAVLITDIKDLGEEGITFALDKSPEKQTFRLFVPGRHNAHNAALAVLAGLCCGLTMKEAAVGLEKLEAGDKRLHIIERGGIRIIDDTYNANPDSMRAGLDVLAAVKGGRKVAILGDMLGLGAEEEKYHRQIGEYASQRGVNVVISVGNNARYISEGAEGGGSSCVVMHFDEREVLEARLRELILPGDVVLVKASRAMAMDKTVKKLGE